MPLEIKCMALRILSKDILIVTLASKEVCTILSKKFMDFLLIDYGGKKDHVSVCLSHCYSKSFSLSGYGR